MATTTTMTAICNSLEILIASLTPAGGNGTALTGGIKGNTAYEYIKDLYWKGDAEEVPDHILDRAFIIEDVTPQDVAIQGGLTESVWLDELVVKIGHQWTNHRAGRNRREQDLHQIVSQLIKESNRPDGVHVVRFTGSNWDKIKEGLFYFTELTFSVQYMMLANYGG